MITERVVRCVRTSKLISEDASCLVPDTRIGPAINSLLNPLHPTCT